MSDRQLGIDELYRKMREGEQLNAGIPICFCIDDSFSMWKYGDEIREGIARFLTYVKRTTQYEEAAYLSFAVANSETKLTRFEQTKNVESCPSLHPRGSVKLSELLYSGIDMLDEFEGTKASPMLVLITDGVGIEKESEDLENICENLEDQGYQLMVILPNLYAMSPTYAALGVSEKNIAYFGKGCEKDFAALLFDKIKSFSDSGDGMSEDLMDENLAGDLSDVMKVGGFDEEESADGTAHN